MGFAKIYRFARYFPKYRNIQLSWRIKCHSTSNKDLAVIFQIFSMNLLQTIGDGRLLKTKRCATCFCVFKLRVVARKPCIVLEIDSILVYF